MPNTGTASDRSRAGGAEEVIQRVPVKEIPLMRACLAQTPAPSTRTRYSEGRMPLSGQQYRQRCPACHHGPGKAFAERLIVIGAETAGALINSIEAKTAIARRLDVGTFLLVEIVKE